MNLLFSIKLFSPDKVFVLNGLVGLLHTGLQRTEAVADAEVGIEGVELHAGESRVVALGVV